MTDLEPPADPEATGFVPSGADERQPLTGQNPVARRGFWRTTSPDRQTISNQRVWTLTVLVGVMLWSALGSLPGGQDGRDGRNFAAQAATLCAVLAMFGLRSVPVRWIVRGIALLSGLLLARFGELGALDGVQGSWRVLLWLAAVAGALVLAPSSRTVPGVDPGTVVRADQAPRAAYSAEAGRAGDRGDSRDPQDRSSSRGTGAYRVRARGGVPVALIVAAVALIGAGSLLVGPRVANWFPAGSSAGNLVDSFDNRSDNALVSRDTLDMTQRPRLSQQVVMSVRSPVVSFWRAETFDEWDGSTWTRSVGNAGRLVENGKVVPSVEDLAAREGEPSTQEFRLEIGFATAVPSAASPVRIDAADEIDQRSDGTLWTPGRPMGEGTTYTVESRQIPTDAAALRDGLSASDAADEGDDVAAEVVERYGQPTQMTDRVAELAATVTASARNDYDRITALENWMGDNTTYSIEAPLAPGGVDVVDDFLFESKEGWCEQIASSLVVMARASGVPARLATGFAPGEYDEVGGRFIVREADAHAWAEVWFPETGWVSFDPTADVPLAGTDEATAGADAQDWREVAGALLLAVGVMALSAAPVMRLVRRLSKRVNRRLEHRRVVRERWDAAAEARLEHIGASAGRPRAPDETLTRYAAAVARVVDDDRVGRVGVLVDRTRYGPDSLPTPPTSSAAGVPPPSGISPAPTDGQEFVEQVLSEH